MGEHQTERERQRLETRRRLLEAGQKLVAEHGYGETTVAQIAGAAGVTERTFFRHFKSKKDLFLANWQAIAGSMEQTMRELPATVPAYDVAVSGIREFAHQAELIIEREPPASMGAFSHNAPALEAILTVEATLTSTLAWRLGLDSQDVQVQSLANATVGVLRATIRSYSGGRRERPLPEAATSNMEQLRPLYEALTRGGASTSRRTARR